MLAYMEPLVAAILGIAVLSEPLEEPLLLLPLLSTFCAFLLARFLDGGEQLFQSTKNKAEDEIAQEIFNLKLPYKANYNENLLELWAHEIASPWIVIKDSENSLPVCEVHNDKLENIALDKFLSLNHNIPKTDCRLLKWTRGRKVFASRSFDFVARSFEGTTVQIYTSLSISLGQSTTKYFEEIDFDPRVDIMLFCFYPIINKDKLGRDSFLKLCLNTEFCFAKKGEKGRDGFFQVEIYEGLTLEEIYLDKFPERNLVKTVDNFIEFHETKNNYIKQGRVYLIDTAFLEEGREGAGETPNLLYKQLGCDPGDLSKTLREAPDKQCYAYARKTRYELINESMSLRVRIGTEQEAVMTVYNREKLAEICLQAYYLANGLGKSSTLLGSKKTIKAIFIDDDNDMLDDAQKTFEQGNWGIKYVNKFYVKSDSTIDEIKEILPKKDDEIHIVFIDVVLFPNDRKLSQQVSQEIYQEVLTRHHFPFYFTGAGGDETNAVYASRKIHNEVFLSSVRKGIGVHLQKLLDKYFETKFNIDKISDPEELCLWLNEILTKGNEKLCPLEKKVWEIFETKSPQQDAHKF